MKKLAIAILVGTLSTLQAQAQEVEFEAGAELTSQYVWRGMRTAGLQFQPEATMTIGNLSVNAWASFGAEDWGFHGDYKELDLTLSYELGPVELSLTNYYYFSGRFIGTRNALYDDGSQLEAGIKYTFPNIPLYIAANTVIAGADGRLEVFSNLPVAPIKRAYSTYIEVGYEWGNEEKGWNYQVQAGFSPWKGMYGNYLKGGFNNLTARVDKSWPIGNAQFYTFLQPSFNLVSKHTQNYWHEIFSSNSHDFEDSWFQWGYNANLTIGMGISF